MNISLYEPVDGEKMYEGTLEEVNEDSLILTIRIKTREKKMEFDRKKIAKARLAIKF